ncbi:MAG: NAD(P)-dependent oxidoreductase [Pseudomonadota bacterium]
MIGKLVLTGAAGALGSRLRKPLSKMCETLVTTDVEVVADTLPNETFVQADLSDFDAIAALIDGAEMVVHFGAIVDEKPFEELLGPNFIGSYNVWEAAFRTGARRVIYASSIHAVGMQPVNANIGIDAPHAPDTFYGLAKCFTEDLGRMYWDKRGLESVHLRILSCAPVKNARALGTWLSYDDMVRLVVSAIQTQVTGFSVIYGVSDNDRAPVNNDKARHLGYAPKDNAEQFAKEILEGAPKGDPKDPAQFYVGGPFAVVDLGQSGMDAMRSLNKATSGKE